MPFGPFRDPQMSLGNLQDEFNRLVGRVWHAGVSMGPFDGQEWGPVVDTFEHPDRYTLYAEVPGVDGNEIEITQLGGSLTIRGEKRRPSGLGPNNRPLRGERRYGTFCRTIELPPGGDVSRLTAKCHAGILEITIPKSEASKPKSVKVQVQDDK